MNAILELAARGLVMGVGAAALMDVWGVVLRRGFGVPTLDYAMLGRWIGHMRGGVFAHDRIAVARAVRGERPLGWLAHYAIGVAFAIVLLVLVGPDWAHSPTLWPALALGLATIVAPWFVMQPGMGAGIAASRTQNPTATRLRNLATHTVYGIGLYLTAAALTVVAA
jgi:hypothetical protein